ncbi:MAG: hypothetical protein V4692_13195, partial [Bdellovibrionota bacterium]
MNKLIFLTVVAAFSTSHAAGPYTLPAFAALPNVTTGDSVVVFESFYKSDTNVAVKTSQLPPEMIAALEEELQPSAFERSPAAVIKKSQAVAKPAAPTGG